MAQAGAPDCQGDHDHHEDEEERDNEADDASLAGHRIRGEVIPNAAE